MRRFRLKPDVPVRLFVYLYFGAFVLGILAVNQLWKVEGFRDYVSVYAVLEQYKVSQIDVKKYGLFILREKSLFVGVSLLAGFAGAGEILAILVSLWLGFLAGGLAVLFLLQSGLKGFLFCMMGILSQMIFYIPALVTFLLLMGKHRRTVQGYPVISGKELRWPLLLCVIFLCCMLLGILIETYVNSVLWIKIFM